MGLGFELWEKVCPFFFFFQLRGRELTQGSTVNSESLEISFLHLSDQKAILAYFLANSPSTILPLFDSVALSVILLYYPHYERIHSEVHVRITELPTSYTLRDLRQVHLDALVRVSGVVTRRAGVLPQLKYVKFDCGRCGDVIGPVYQTGAMEVRVGFCPGCGSKGPFSVNSEQVRCFFLFSLFHIPTFTPSTFSPPSLSLEPTP